LFPRLPAVVLEEPERPAVLQRVKRHRGQRRQRLRQHLFIVTSGVDDAHLVGVAHLVVAVGPDRVGGVVELVAEGAAKLDDAGVEGLHQGLHLGGGGGGEIRCEENLNKIEICKYNEN
jgi:hypothetical protein